MNVTLVNPATGTPQDYTKDQLENLGIDEIRRLLRKNFPTDMTGMVGANIKKVEGIPVLLGEKSAEEAASEVKVRITAGAHNPAGTTPLTPRPATAPTGGLANIGTMIQTAVDAATAGVREELEARFNEERTALGEIIDSHSARNKELLAEIDTLRTAALQARQTPIQLTPGQDVEIQGVKYPAIGGSDHIPAIDPCFLWEAWKAESVIGPITVRFSASDVLRKLHKGSTIWIDGPTGCGKTTLFQQFGAQLAWPVIRIQGDRSMSPDDLLGSWVAKDGKTQYIHGPLPIAMKIGAILIIDEADKFPPHCTQILHAVLENGATGNLVIPANHGEVITPHPNFRVVATSNDLYLENAGLHPDAQAQDTAYINRFDKLFRAVYCTKEQEAEILKKHGLPPQKADEWVGFATLTREAYANGEIESPVSTRNLVRLARDPDAHTNFAKTLCCSVLNRYSTAEAPKILELAQRAIADTSLTQSVIE